MKKLANPGPAQRYYTIGQTAKLLGISTNRLKSILLLVDDGELGVHVHAEKPGSLRKHRRFTKKSLNRLRAVLKLKEAGVKYSEMTTLMISRAVQSSQTKN